MASSSDSQVQHARRKQTITVAAASAVAVIAVVVLVAVFLSTRKREPEQSSIPPTVQAPPTSNPSSVTSAPVAVAPASQPAATSAAPSPAASNKQPTSPSTKELALVRDLQSNALDARRRAVDAGASSVQLDSGDAHSKLASMLLFDGKTTEAGEQLNRAMSSWNAAERAARAASLAAAARTTVAEPAKPQVLPPPVSVSAPQQAVQQAPPPAPPPANPSVDIAAVVNTYAHAIETRDVAAVRRAYPGITAAQAKGWEQFFPTLRSLRVTISISGLDVNGSTADAKLIGAYDYVTEAGKTEHQPVSFQASFRREGTTWQLVSVH